MTRAFLYGRSRRSKARRTSPIAERLLGRREVAQPARDLPLQPAQAELVHLVAVGGVERARGEEEPARLAVAPELGGPPDDPVPRREQEDRLPLAVPVDRRQP